LADQRLGMPITTPKWKPCPQDGRHCWIMHIACILVNSGMNDWEAMQIIRRELTREPRPNEIEDALFAARSTRGDFGATRVRVRSLNSPSEVKQPVYEPQKLAGVAAKVPLANIEWLVEHSPIDVATVSTEEFLHHLYLPGEQVLIFSEFCSQGQKRWQHLGDDFEESELQDFKKHCDDGVWFLCNPCDGQYKEIKRRQTLNNPTGRTRRSEENITSFRYAVLESDEAPPDQWIAALAQMPLPVVSVVSSGGRSLHALVRVDASTKQEWDKIVRERLRNPLVILGADGGALTAVRLSRLPGCLRYQNGDGKRYKAPRMQELLYLNPSADCTPIIEQSTKA